MIKEIIDNKLDYAEALLESDPNINLVTNYLNNGRLFVYIVDEMIVSFIAIKEIDDSTVEIKNLLTLENYRSHGYARELIKYIESLYVGKTILIGTANSSMSNMTLYTKLGYKFSHKIEDFFVKYYPNEIIENGIKAVDLMYFKKDSR